MPVENPVSVYSTPAMSAEAETAMFSEARPIRVSGFLSLFLGLLGFTVLLGTPMVIVPIAATLLALISLRPYSGQRPAGYTAGMLGLFAGVMFVVLAATANQLRTQTLSDQAVQFASNWLELVAQGDLELAIELQVHPTRRQGPSMSLKDYYSLSEEGRTGMKLFLEVDSVEPLIAAGNRVRWKPVLPPVIYTLNGRQMVRTLWEDQSRIMRLPFKVTLEYFAATDSSPAQWKVDSVGSYIEDTAAH